MAVDCAVATGYIVVYLTWARLVRSYVEPWLRGRVGKHLGIAIAWVPLSVFPVKVWAWGLLASGKRQLEAGLALCSTALCLSGAFLPLASLSFFLWRTGLSSLHAREALYLISPLLLLLFVGSQLVRDEKPMTAQKK